jgi:perosamine synthetase
MDKIHFFNSYINPESIKLALECLKSTMISEGVNVEIFENKLCQILNSNYVATVNSGTSAIHLSLVIAGIKENDEVILPPQTFIATGTAILMQKAKPIFADINPLDGNISVKSIEEKITERTKAIIPVHWGGYPCDMKEINNIAKKYNLTVIEDAAHALGSIYQGKCIGAISRFTAFSFQAIKHLTTGDGGAISFSEPEDYIKAKKLRWFGIDRKKDETSILGERVYDLKELGFKYHMNDLCAAIGIGNLTNYNDRLNKVQIIAKQYRQELKNTTGLQLLQNKSDRISSNWLFTILVENRDNFIKLMLNKSIPVSVVHLGIDKNTIFGNKNYTLIGQREFDEKQISIPIHSELNEEQIEWIIKTVKSGW